MTRAHFTHPYLIDPRHPVTVNLVGAGGTGSQVLTCLARLDAALRALGHPGLFVTLYDPDAVGEANIGRQLFGESDVGLNKAECLVTRTNHFFGNDWRAIPAFFGADHSPANLTLTCTDTVASRLKAAEILNQSSNEKYVDHTTPLYWIDFGNAQRSGQVVVGTVPKNIPQPRSKQYTAVPSLPTVVEIADYTRLADEDSGPSCSLAEALDRQDLFVNSVLAQLGCAVLWKMFRHGLIFHRGLYLNLETTKVNPIEV